jgi:hypothetical protein
MDYRVKWNQNAIYGVNASPEEVRFISSCSAWNQQAGRLTALF